jgi:hypothetical protein
MELMLSACVALARLGDVERRPSLTSRETGAPSLDVLASQERRIVKLLVPRPGPIGGP